MRQRHVHHEEEPKPVAAPKAFTKRIAEVDFFPKPKEDYQREQTKHGALVSLATVVIIGLLVLWEGIAYLRGRDAYDTDVTIDAGATDDMPVHLDVLFPNMQCHRLSIDVIDATGAQIYNYSGNIHKLPCKVGGESLYQGTQKDLDLALERHTSGNSTVCKKCPVDALRHLPENVRAAARSQCCNNCQSVQAIFYQAGEKLPGVEYIPQCLEELSTQGACCNVVGFLELKKVPVTVILGPRRTGTAYSYKNILRLDTSHIINKLRIGDETVERFSEHGVSEPLSGHRSISSSYLETRYVVNVVPTTYLTRKYPKPTASTYEYSAQWNKRPIAPGLFGKVPAVLFRFEPSALQVNNIFQRPPLTHFFVQLCGIVGGVFVILGFVDRIVEWCVHNIK